VILAGFAGGLKFFYLLVLWRQVALMSLYFVSYHSDCCCRASHFAVCSTFW